MDHAERQLIQDLFVRLREAESQIRDPQAEQLIADELRRAPHAPYTMAQIILAQNQALEKAAARIEVLEGGGGRQADEPATPWAGAAPGNDRGLRGSVPAFGGRAGGAPAGGGFLANAGQMAVGVAGGMLLGELAKNLLGGGSEAQAATPDAASAAANPLAEQAGAEDVGGNDTAGADDAGAEEGGGGLFGWLFGGGAQEDGAADDGYDVADGGWDDGGGWDSE